MRLALVTHYYPAHGGGIEIVAQHLARALARMPGVHVSWAASDCDAAPEATESLEPRPMRTANWIERWLPFPFPLWSLRSLAALRRLVASSDAVLVHDFPYPGNLCALLFARWARRPVLLTQHIGAVPFNSRVLRAVHALVNRTLGRWVLGRAERVVFISDTVSDYFARFVRYARAPRVVPNGVDTATFRPLPADERAKLRHELGIAADARVLLFAGRFVEKKGLEVLRHLVGLLPDAQWIFAGQGSIRPEAWGRACVRVEGERSGRALAELYQAADVLVLPSVGEGFPLVIQEALACGTPALTNAATLGARWGGRPFLMGERICGSGREAQTAQLWSTRLRALLDRPATLAELRAPAAEFARSQWCWERAAQQHAELIREMLAHG